jgi:cystathionine beta-lyase/cystathionine gamma-synthase
VGFQTDAIHAGQSPDASTGAIITPVYQTSTYVQEKIARHKGHEYARTSNPTRSAMESNIATLEKGKYGVAFASGMAAIHAILSLLRSGDHVVVTRNIYGGTQRLFRQVLQDIGIQSTFIDTSNPEAVEQACKPNTRMLFIETPTNPMLVLSPLAKLAEISKKRGLVSVVDNTFMSPYFQNPLTFDIDIVVHSSTKYLNGHSDVIGGIVITNSEQVAERLYFLQNAIGAVPGPHDCWLVLRATKTLALRMREHEKNALAIAGLLQKNSSIRSVIYPGLPGHPQHELAKSQMSGFGGMISVDMGSFDQAERFVGGLKLFALAESLGGVESLVNHPARMTHASVPADERADLGITDSLIRLSIGIEDEEDLIADVKNALESLP